MTVVRVADVAGVARRTVTRIEAGQLKHGPNTSTVEALAQALAVSPGWLAGWE